MILYSIKTRSGEDEYENYGYYETFTKKDFDNQNLTDLTILSEYYDHHFTEEDAEADDGYWYGDKIVWVSDVRDITKEEILVLHNIGILYYAQVVNTKPTETKDYTVKFDVNIWLDKNYTIEATSQEEAEEKAKELAMHTEYEFYDQINPEPVLDYSKLEDWVYGDVKFSLNTVHVVED